MITAQGADQQETAFSTEDSDQTRAVDVPETLTEVQNEDVDTPSEESDEQHGTRRGRRRRGGKSRRRNEEKGNEPGERGVSRAGDSTLEEGEEDRRRGRGHEKIDEAEAEVEAADLPAPEAIEQEADDDTEIEELGDFSNWNVPSWNELIASLYRPER
jgi:hypothetical protein